MKIAWLSPLPPVRSGIASYSMMVLPRLVELADVTVVVDQEEIALQPDCDVIPVDAYRERRGRFDAAVAQIGNNLHHEFVLREASEHPTVVVLHEVVLHHLMTEMTLARGDAESFARFMKESEGSAGEAFARGRARGFHFENGNFLFPGSAALAASARAVIVHNRWARERLRAAGVRAPIRVVDHPFDELSIGEDGTSRQRIETDHGFPSNSRIIGMFGFVTWPKRPEIVFEAFARARRSDSGLRLLVVGEPAPNVDLEDLARTFEVPGEAWSATGWVSDEEFDTALAAVDRVVSLRYPSAGESSGAVVRILAAGKPIAVSDYAQFTDFPKEVVTKIPLAESEVPELARFMTDDIEGMADAQRAWIRQHGDPMKVAEEYLDVVRSVVGVPETVARRVPPATRSALGLMPKLSVESLDVERVGGALQIRVELRNEGETELRSHVWGTPAYRLIVKTFSGEDETSVDWWPLPGDLPPGRLVTVSGRIRDRNADRVALLHGWFDIPVVDESPFFERGVVS